MEVGKEGGGMRMEKDFAWGDGLTMQCADDVLLSYTFETYWFCKPMSPQ